MSDVTGASQSPRQCQPPASRNVNRQHGSVGQASGTGARTKRSHQLTETFLREKRPFRPPHPDERRHGGTSDSTVRTP